MTNKPTREEKIVLPLVIPKEFLLHGLGLEQAIEKINELIESNRLLREVVTTSRLLSKAQQNVLNYYKENQDSTYVQAGEKLGISPPGIYKHVVNLERLGLVRRDSRGGVHLLVQGE